MQPPGQLELSTVFDAVSAFSLHLSSPCDHLQRAIAGLSWSLCCGAISPVAYFYAIYFLVLLIHRAMRDDHFCSLKCSTTLISINKSMPADIIVMITRNQHFNQVQLRLKPAQLSSDLYTPRRYGKDWQQYKKHVPAMFIPGVI